MVKPEQFTITFEEDRTVFFSGHNIAGQIIFSFSRPERAKSLSLYFLGQESSFIGTIGSKTRTFEEREIFKTKLVLWQEQETQYFEAKQYIFPFEVDLGKYNFPSSYEGDNGHIRYKFKAVIDRPSRFGHSCSVPITLLSSIPTFLSNCIVPESYQVESSLGIMKREVTKMVVDSTIRSCRPGGFLLLDVSFFPRYSKSIQGIELKLLQNIEVLVNSRTHTFQNIISQLQLPISAIDESNQDQQDTLELLKLHVADTTPPTIDTSQLIKINYQILVTAQTSLSFSTLAIKIPIVISTLDATMDEVPTLVNDLEYIEPILHAGVSETHDLPLPSEDNVNYYIHDDIPDLVHSRKCSSLNSFSSSSSFGTTGSLSSPLPFEEFNRRKTGFQPNYSSTIFDKRSSRPNSLFLDSNSWLIFQSDV